MQLSTASYSHVGKVRELNQDALLAEAASGLFLMADGMGGEQAGEEASAQVVATVARELLPVLAQPELEPAGLIEALQASLLAANQEVMAIGRAEPAKRGLGSTASLLCLRRGLATLGHVGDSRIYLLRQGQVRQLTRDHSVVWLMYERGTLSRRQLESHPERHLLTQCIGDPRPINVETLQIPAEPGDLFLLCSDGLTGYAPEAAIFSLLLHPELTLEEKTRRLIEMALHGGGGDNVSVILARVEALDAGDDWQPVTSTITATLTIPPPPLEPDPEATTVAEELPGERLDPSAEAEVAAAAALGQAWQAHQRQLRAAQRRLTFACILLIALGAALLLVWTLNRP